MRFVITFILFFSGTWANPPTVVVFDYGGVVAKVSRGPLFHFLAESFDTTDKKVRKDFPKDKLYKALNEPSFQWELYAKQPIPHDFKENLEAFKKELTTPTTGIDKLICRLKAQGIRVALLSNTSTERGAFLETMGAYDAFDPVLLSCKLGTKKPKREIYEKLLTSLDEQPENVLFIDNKWRNVKSAKKMGIDGIHFKSVNQLNKELKKREIQL